MILILRRYSTKMVFTNVWRLGLCLKMVLVPALEAGAAAGPLLQDALHQPPFPALETESLLHYRRPPRLQQQVNSPKMRKNSTMLKELEEEDNDVLPLALAEAEGEGGVAALCLVSGTNASGTTCHKHSKQRSAHPQSRGQKRHHA